MEVDTGAAVSLMAENTQRKLFLEAVLEPSQVRLSTYSAEAPRVVGAIRRSAMTAMLANICCML